MNRPSNLPSMTSHSIHSRTSIRPNMERAGSSLDRLVAGSLQRSPEKDAPILAWPVACGSAVAQRTRALDFGGGILRVEVPDLGWRTELQALAPRYVAAMNRYVRQKVTRVEFVIAPKSAGDVVPSRR